VDQAGAEAARVELARVQAETRPALVREAEGTPKHRQATRRRTDAEAAVDACYETLTLRALPPARWEELSAAHPPTAAQMDRCKAEREQAAKRGEEPLDWPSYDDATFWPAALAECVDGDMTGDDWTAFLAEHVSRGEVRGLKLAVLQVNTAERVADPLVLPKGWTGTTS
jgi:hypothetical protein